MRDPRTKLAAAALIAVMAVVSIGLWDKSLPAAYAMEQTIQASHSVRYLRIRDFQTGREEPKEFWLQFDEAGRIENIRAHMPEWEAPADGARIVVWHEGKARVWFKNRKTLVTFSEKRFADEMLKAIQLFDPKWALQRFLELEDSGLVRIEIKEPAQKTEPITITSTNAAQLKEVGYQPDRTVLLVDQATKLLSKIEQYHRMANGDYELSGWTEFHGYNEPIAPERFVLDDVPVDVARVDQTTPEIGLPRGDLSEKEIAVQVVREFYEAVIAKDYAKAGRLLGGLPAARMEETFKDLKIIRIVSIGEPKPHPTPSVGGLMVPCQLEVEKNGVKSIYEPYGPGVRPVYNQPERWNIHGGVK